MNVPTRSSQRRTNGRAQRSRGAATLIVVMVLFFIVSMVAAYTSRNLLFEQRTSSNQLRSITATEAADAGLNWAIGMLNSGRITPTCNASVSTADNTFRERYLTIDGANGKLTPRTKTNGNTLLPSCVYNGVSWNCSCPVDADPLVAVPVGSDVFPGFRIRFMPGDPARQMTVWVEVNGCTRYADACLNFPAAGIDNEGRAKVSALVTLKGAVTTAPAAALTARQGVSPDGGSSISVFNTSAKSSGLTVHAGGAIDQGKFVAKTLPGSPPAGSFLASDPPLQFTAYPPATLPTLTKPLAMFLNTFGMLPGVYETQQAAVVLTCAPCTATQIRDAVERNPLRVIWVNGSVNLDAGGDIGSATEPVALVATGNIVFSAPISFFGLMYSRADPWTLTGNGTVVGAAVAENGLDGVSTATLVYDKEILDLVRYRTGSFVMVPGTWRDF